MPGQKSKKQKTEKVKIKLEPQELKPLSEYVDDRLELIKQAFSCLKPKQIKAVTPKFLQNKSLEDIQEQCLDEVLGISNKRLISIINNQKCPTDTESSSDEDNNDVEQVVEHISLDEISSEDENETKAKIKKKPEEGEPPKKEYSVLELLELQARARAIRSQLALEPVTKIELDDETPETSQNNGTLKTTESSENKEKHKKDKKSSSTKLKNGNSSSSEKKNKNKKEKIPDITPKIKIKRNFRKRSEEKEIKKEKDNSDKKNKNRDSSPEVMTILASPETLCISSDDDEKEKQSKTTESKPIETISSEKSSPKPLELPEDGEICDEAPSKDTSIEEEPKIAEEKPEDKEEKLENEQINPESTEKEPTEEICNTDTFDENLEQEKVEDEKIDDDYIELECNDLIEEEAESTSKPQESSKSESEEKPVEISDSDEEGSEEKKGEDSNDSKTESSWNSRWLESSKVTKILAASRIGNSVRRKIKSKKLKKDKEKEQEIIDDKKAAEEKIAKEKESPVADVDIGSVTHYQKILEKESQNDKE